MDCNQEENMERSKSLFLRARRVDSFINLWAKFYDNEICVPHYLDNFVGSDDNPQATKDMGAKFKQITSYNILPYDFQTNSLKDGQKAYVSMFVPNDLAQHLPTYINRYPGYISYWQDITDSYLIRGLYVTYDPTKEQSEITERTGVLMGDAYTNVGYGGMEPFEFITEWMSGPVREDINPETYKHVMVIDTIPSETEDRILDMILTALADR